MKHRRNKVKREHGIIQNALLWLESISRLAEVTDIIPGVIDVNRSSERGIVYKYETQTGCKLLLKSNGSIQEAFVVTKHPERVQEWVNKEFPPDSPPTIPESISPNDFHETKKKISKISSKPAVKLEYKPSMPRRQSKKQKRPHCKAVPSYFKDDDALNVADRLDISTLKALKQFKKSLETVKIENLNAKGKRKS
ncbi:DUF2103 domain-containing protein [Desulfosporosinus nitroreducens]|uniref:DUF2103 domain-containing protein n=1 Tax=Desulfosporosinus nitroreducens TaxID=2018668 RepID=A0ABT8QN32_9FIRM|nr:DUF2103 domain-containing protein [Desulfosporosinus nitroreducens]MDO0821508.1 DUF2103 domain-containing protein [Desulfosporosinus nitroreducens]